jgi:uncharacterized protein YeaO (DUF488 family)
MTVRIVRLGTRRLRGEGLRIGTVRKPPRGVPRNRHASGNWYDVWFPEFAPSAATVRIGRSAGSDQEWARFARRYRAEMNSPSNRRALDLLAALSHRTNFSVGCYCADAARCHRSLLRALLLDRGADVR